MPPTDPTSSASSGALGALTLVLLALTLCYLLTCAVWPYRAHRPCRGTGRHFSPGGRAFRPCRGCRGTGRKLRTGRRVWNVLARYRHARRDERSAAARARAAEQRGRPSVFDRGSDPWA